MKKSLGLIPLFLAAFFIAFPVKAHATETDLMNQMIALQNAQALVLAQGAAATDLDMAQPAFPVTDLAAQPAAPVVNEQPATAALLPTYVDVSIDTQTMIYYENGIPVLVSPCVTGKPGRGTPRGVFAINTKTPGKYLTGPSWHVWVNRWMRFAGNCGLHDASWRKQFGGEIYKSNGSHGCVNLPHDVAVALYDRVGIGTTVIVH